MASKANNSLLIRATPADYERVEATLADRHGALAGSDRGHDRRVTLNDQLRYGVQYFLESGSFAGGFNSLAGTVAGTASLIPRAILPGFNFLFTPGGSNITIDALSRVTNVRVLSSPSVVVQDNSEAVLTVGEVPVQTQQQQSISTDSNILNSIEYRDTGVILQVRPRINSNQAVSLEIAQEVSRVANPNVATLTPTFTQRKVTSRVNIQSGQTVVLGGLIQDSEETGRDRIPVLGEIPCWGACSARPTPRTSVPS